MLGNLVSQNGTNPTEWEQISTNKQIKELKERIEVLSAELENLSEKVVTSEIESSSAEITHIDTQSISSQSIANSGTIGTNRLETEDAVINKAYINEIENTVEVNGIHVNKLEVEEKVDELNVGNLTSDNFTTKQLAVKELDVDDVINTDTINTNDINTDTIKSNSADVGEITTKKITDVDKIVKDDTSITLDDNITLKASEDVIHGKTTKLYGLTSEDPVSYEKTYILTDVDIVKELEDNINKAFFIIETSNGDLKYTANAEYKSFSSAGQLMYGTDAVVTTEDSADYLDVSLAVVEIPFWYDSHIDEESGGIVIDKYYADEEKTVEITSDVWGTDVDNKIALVKCKTFEQNTFEGKEYKYVVQIANDEITEVTIDGKNYSTDGFSYDDIETYMVGTIWGYPLYKAILTGNYVNYVSADFTDSTYSKGVIKAESPIETPKITTDTIEVKDKAEIENLTVNKDLNAYHFHGTGKINCDPELMTEGDWYGITVPNYKNAIVFLRGSYNGSEWQVTLTKTEKAGTVIYSEDTQVIKDISYNRVGNIRVRAKAEEYIYFSIYVNEKDDEEIHLDYNAEAYEDYIFNPTTLYGYTFVAFGDNTLSMHFPGTFSADVIKLGTAEFEEFTIDDLKVNYIEVPDVYDDMGNVQTRTRGDKNQYLRVSNTTIDIPVIGERNYLEYVDPIKEKVANQSDVLTTEKSVARYDGSSTNEDGEVEYNIKHLSADTVVHGGITVNENIQIRGDETVNGDARIDGDLSVGGNTLGLNDVYIIKADEGATIQIRNNSDDVIDLANVKAEDAYHSDESDEATHAIDADNAINDKDGNPIDETYIKVSEKAQPNGVATLDETGRIPAEQLTLKDLTFEGMWDASTNTPTLSNDSGTKGDYYITEIAGTQDLGNGSVYYNVGDELVYDGEKWVQLKSGTVDSVNGQLPVDGNVTLYAKDIKLNSTSNTTLDNLLWSGTKTAYDALAKDANVFYFVEGN